MYGLSSTALQWLGVGGLLAVVGSLIKFRQWTFLLAGYDKTAPVPDDVVAEIAGNTVLRIGLAGIALGILIAAVDTPSYLPLIFEGVIVLAIVRLLYRLHTYTPTSTA